MSENIEKAVQTEESSETKVTEATAPAATDNVVLYPISDEEKTVSVRRKLQILKAKLPTVKLPITLTNSVTLKIQKNLHQKMWKKKTMIWKRISTNNRKKSHSKDEHPFREFFSNFRSKRKIEMNRDEQILSRISDEDLMEYLRMEQKRMELLQQAKEVREKRFWTTFQLAICLLSVILVIYFLKDNPVILVTILYTFGILAALRIWSKAQNGKDSKGNKDKTDA